MFRAWVLFLLLVFQGLLYAGPDSGPVATPATSATTPISTEPLPLSSSQGYLVLDLRLEQRVSEVSFKGLRSSLGPFEKGRHLLLIPMKKGKYSLLTVASPSYDLPFKWNYSDYKRLQFEVLPGRVNYFAQIIVGDLRSSYGFEIHVRNRLAYTYGELLEKYGQQLAQYPIHYAGPITDHFYNEFLKPPETAEADE